GVGVSSALCNAGKFVWDWPVVARGEGFVPPSKALVPPRGGSVEPSRYLMGCHINDSAGGQNEEEAIVYSGMSQSYSNSREFSV
ncbi:endonuclease or glycosyl hydrolase, partial [Trifolium medium]|nr:endonuclease or glycosyl hydrolase [Trifolium medium]